MKILVCIKQIPDTSDIKWSKDNNIIREGAISILNPYDIYGILTAKKIKEQLNCNIHITLLSMGPENTVQSIREGLSLGADDAILLSDKKFSGADTLATAKTLYCAIKNYIKDYDLIITGQFALDGDTAQTPYSLANLLEVPHIGYVSKIKSIDENGLVVVSIKDDGEYEIKGKYPMVISVSAFVEEIYKPLIKDQMRAQDAEIKILNAGDIKADFNDIGIKGSPTYVSKAYRPENHRECKFVDYKEQADSLWKF